MSSIFNKIKRKISETSWKYYRTHSNVRILHGGIAEIDKSATIKNSIVFIDATSKLIIKGHARIEGVGLFLTNGAVVEISEYSFIEYNRNSIRPEYIIDGGKLVIADHTKLACARLWVRFGGNITIGKYTNINPGTEIRADESVTIGNFCRISYNIRIWDTNTHCVYSPEIRMEMTQKYFPAFGKEFERPKTKPVVIGNGCWLGERVSILKGTTLGENVTIAYGATISNKEIPAGKTVVQKLDLKLF